MEYTYDRVLLKRKAREIIGKGTPSPLIIGSIVVMFTIVINTLVSRVILINYDISGMATAMAESDIEHFYYYVAKGADIPIPPTAYLIYAALNMISVIVSFGFSIFIANTVRNSEPCVGNLLDGFGMFFKILWLTILQYLIISILSLLLIFPGLIAFYCFRQAKYILIDNPEKRVIDCLKESKEMMKGNKLTLFELDLSFILWYIISILPIVKYIALFQLYPYRETSYVLFYDFISGKPIDFELPV